MDTKTAIQMANLYGLKSSIAFNKMMVKCGILMHTSKGYVLAEAMRGKGYTIPIIKWFFLPNGIKASKKVAAWTEKGQQMIHKHLSRLGILPKAEQTSLFSA